MNYQELQEAVKEAMTADPTEMVVSYYKGLIQHNADIIADCQKQNRKFKRRIADLTAKHTTSHKSDKEQV